MSAGVTKRAVANGLLLLCATLLGFAACEAGLRIVYEVRLLSTENFRAAGVAARNYNLTGGSEYEPVLGWNLKSQIEVTGFHTLDHGIRTNGRSESAVRTGGVLAVGDSFTAGSEVPDEQTWPAQLEKIIGEPVLNAGNGGYGTDQIVLRAEQLLPAVRPKVLLIGILEQDILRAGFDMYGAPKPYFTVENGELIPHNNPVPRVIETEDRLRGVKDFLGHFVTVDQLMTAVAPEFWFLGAGSRFRRIATDEVAVTCGLLKRLKERTDALGVRTLVVMQYGAALIRQRSEPTAIALSVERCADQMGIQIVDEFESLRAIATSDPAEFRKYYVVTREVYGHMSGTGNLHVARLIATALARPPLGGTAAGFVQAALVPGDGRNLLRSESLTEQFQSTDHATIAAAQTSGRGARHYVIAAAGQGGEHYVATESLDLAAGPYTVSMEVSAKDVGRLRIQLVEGQANAVIGNVDLSRQIVLVDRVGQVFDAGAKITSISDGWFRFSMTGTFAAGRFRIILQPTNANGDTLFQPNGESMLVRALQLEHGQTAARFDTRADSGR